MGIYCFELSLKMYQCAQFVKHYIEVIEILEKVRYGTMLPKDYNVALNG